MQETHTRSLLKTITWRVVATASMFSVTFAMTGSWGEAGGIALVTAAVSTLLYYLHERLWDHVDWGRR